jgi:transposase-like protein
MKCKDCKSERVVKAGTQITKQFGRLQRYQCQECGHVFLMPMDKKDDE